MTSVDVDIHWTMIEFFSEGVFYEIRSGAMVLCSSLAETQN